MTQKNDPDRLSNKMSGSGDDDQRPKPPRGFGIVIIMLLLMGMLGFALFSGSIGSGPEKLTVSELHAKLKQGKIKSVVVEKPEAGDATNFKVTGKYVEGEDAEANGTFAASIGRSTDQKLEEAGEAGLIEYDIETSSNMLNSILISILPILLIGLLIWFLFIRRSSGMGGPGGVFNFGRSRAKMFNKEDVSVTFSDVAGVDEAKEELSEIVQFLKNPGRFTRIGAKIPRGVVMFGPPGCGKTLLAKAIAGEAERPFFSISGSDFVEMFVGVGASRVRDLFKNARENAPCILFIDEIDAVGRKRGTGLGGGHDEREQTLNAILVEMDGIGTEEGIIVVAATNRPDVLDPALLRPGRFDRQVVIDLPDSRGRDAIFQVHLKNVKCAPEINTEELAQATPGFSGADIANLINEAALAAVLDNRDLVQMADLLEARDKVRFGRQKRSRIMDDNDRRVTAYHEAGHTVVQYLTKHTDPVHKVTIIPRGMALGATMSLPEKDRYSLSKEHAEEMLQVLYGGRIAEDLFIGSISSGAENDIERATDLATNMVVKYGFSDELGPINFAETEQRDFLGGGITKLKGHSDETASKIDKEIQGFLQQGYENAETLIKEHRDSLENIAEALLKFETLDSTDVKWVMEGKDISEKRKQDKKDKDSADAARRLSESSASVRPRVDSQLPHHGGPTSPEPA